MEEEIEIVFAGTSCDKEEKRCTIYWLSTIKNRKIEVAVDIPYDDVPGKNEQTKEILLEDMFKDTTTKISGCKCPALEE
jgi:hypothetical protein